MPALVQLNAPFGHDLPRALLERAAHATLDDEGIPDAELSVTFLPDEQIREMNARWLGRDRVTDVLSFALHDTGEPPIGDVYVGIEQAERQARDEEVPLEEELARLVIHGTLHVLGYDHPSGEGGEMIERQESLLARLVEGGP